MDFPGAGGDEITVISGPPPLFDTLDVIIRFGRARVAIWAFSGCDDLSSGQLKDEKRRRLSLPKAPRRGMIGPMTKPYTAASTQSPARQDAVQVAFTRGELARILAVYGQFVAAGDWKDYAIDCLKDAAVFSVYRRASEAPLYRIEKRPKLSRKQGAWVVISMSGAILKRGHDLAGVLKVFDRQRLKLAT